MQPRQQPEPVPYSRFAVGAAALVDDGRVTGCNVENVSLQTDFIAPNVRCAPLHSTGGGRLLSAGCVDAAMDPC